MNDDKAREALKKELGFELERGQIIFGDCDPRTSGISRKEEDLLWQAALSREKRIEELQAARNELESAIAQYEEKLQEQSDLIRQLNENRKRKFQSIGEYQQQAEGQLLHIKQLEDYAKGFEKRLEKERERCAEICDTVDGFRMSGTPDMRKFYEMGAQDCAEAIRLMKVMNSSPKEKNETL